MPIPEDDFRTCADWYLVHLMALVGPVVSLDSVAGAYRVHGENNYEPQAADLDIHHLRETIRFSQATSAKLLELADELGLPRPRQILSIADLANRMISLRLEPERHPNPGDRRGRLVADAAHAARRRTNVPAPMKLLFVAWFAAMAVAPRPLARRLALWFLFPQRRRFANRVLGLLQRGERRRPSRPEHEDHARHLDGSRRRRRRRDPEAAGGAAAGPARARARGHPGHDLRRRPRPGRGGRALLESELDAHILDRRRSASARRRWRVRAELAATWARKGWPWRVVCGAAGMQPLIDRVAREREFDVVAVEDNPMAVLRFPAGVPVVFTEHEAIRAPASQLGAARLSERPERALRARDWRRWDSFLPAIWERFELLQVFCEADAAEVRRRAPALAPRVRVNPYGMILPAALRPGPRAARDRPLHRHLRPPAQPRRRPLAGRRDHARGPRPPPGGAPADRRQRPAAPRSSTWPATASR